MSCLNELSSYAVCPMQSIWWQWLLCLVVVFSDTRCVCLSFYFWFLFYYLFLYVLPLCCCCCCFPVLFSMSFCFPFSYFNQQSFHMSLLFLFLLFSLSPYILKEIKFNYATMKKYPSFNKQQRQQQQQQCEQRAKTLACTCYLNMMMSLTALLPQAKLGTSKNKTKKNYPSLVDLHTNVFT